MANFGSFVLTDVGAAVEYKAHLGQVLRFTKFKVGDGSAPSSIKSLTDLVNPLMTLNVARINLQEMSATKKVSIGFNLTSADVETGFYLREIGLYAEDPDTHEDVLVYYGNAGDSADYIPDKRSTTITEKLFDLDLFISDVANITATIDTSMVYMLKSDFQTIISQEFDTTSTYKEGDYVLYNDKLYKALEDITAGSFDDTKWDEVQLVDQLSQLNAFAGAFNYEFDEVAQMHRIAVNDDVDEDVAFNISGGVKVDGEKLSDGVKVAASQPTTKEKVWLQHSKNLFNKNTANIGYSIDSNGNLIEDTHCFASDFIKVDSNTDYYVNSNASVVVGYNSNKIFLGILRNDSSAGSFNSGNAEYIRVKNWWADNPTILNDQLNNAIVNLGRQAIPYEPYVDDKTYIRNTAGGYDEFYPISKLHVLTSNEFIMELGNTTVSNFAVYERDGLINIQSLFFNSTDEYGFTPDQWEYLGQLSPKYRPINDQLYLFGTYMVGSATHLDIQITSDGKIYSKSESIGYGTAAFTNISYFSNLAYNN